MINDNSITGSWCRQWWLWLWCCDVGCRYCNIREESLTFLVHTLLVLPVISVVVVVVVGDVGHSTRNNRHNKTQVISVQIHTTVNSPVLLKLTGINDSLHWFLTMTVMLVHMCGSGIWNIRFILLTISIVAFVAFIFNKLTVYVVLLANSVGGWKNSIEILNNSNYNTSKPQWWSQT